MPTVYVKDKSTFEIIRIEESFSSLVWTERYQAAGEFVLDIPINVANFDVYKRGNYVILDESEEVMVIESLNIDDQQEDPVLEVSGRSLSLILERRINASRLLDNYAEAITYNGDYGTVISSIVNNDIINPYMEYYIWRHTTADGTVEDGYGYNDGDNNYKVKVQQTMPYRAILGFSYTNKVTGVTIDKNYNKLMTIYDILVSFSKAYVTGFTVRLGKNGGFVLTTYKGTDRTSKQKVLDPVIFNPVMDNISYVNYFEDQTDYRNVGLAYSDGCYSNIDFFPENVFSTDIFSGYVWVTKDDSKSNTSISGMNRMEVPFDVRSSASVSSYDPTKEPPEDASEEDLLPIEKKVEAAGNDEFESGDYDFIQTSEGAIDPLVRYQFGVDYFLGDTVEISNNNGVVMTAIIDEVVRSYDSDGFITTPNFKSMADYDYGEEETE